MKVHPLLALIFAAPALAQELLVPDENLGIVSKFSAIDGSLIERTFIDLTKGTGAPVEDLLEAVRVQDQLWISDFNADVLHVWSADGTTYLGEHSSGANGPIGVARAPGEVWVVNSEFPGHGYALLRFDDAGALTGVFPAIRGYDIALIGGEFLVSRRFDDDIFRYALDGKALGIFHQGSDPGEIDHPHQIALRATTGNVIAVGSVSLGIFEYDSAGNQIGVIPMPLQGQKGVYELLNGNFLLSGKGGVSVLDVTTSQMTLVLASTETTFISEHNPGWSPLGLNYCGPAKPHTGGLPARIAAYGSDGVLDNELQLTAYDLPAEQWGIFLTDPTQGFIGGYQGSSGNLCLDAGFGMFPQVTRSGPQGAMVLDVDLTDMPQPGGPVSVLVGETWSFQAWFRDGSINSSNFTDGIAITFH